MRETKSEDKRFFKGKEKSINHIHTEMSTNKVAPAATHECSHTTDHSIEVPDYCTNYENEETYFRQDLPTMYFFGWDCLSFFMVMGVTYVILKAPGYNFIRSKDMGGVVMT